MKLIEVVMDKQNNKIIVEEIKLNHTLFGPFYKIQRNDMREAIFTPLALQEFVSAKNYVTGQNYNVALLRDRIVGSIGEQESTAAIVLACSDIILICAEATSEIYYTKEFSDPIFILETYFRSLGRYDEVELIRHGINKLCQGYNNGVAYLAVVDVLISCFIRIIDLTRNIEDDK